MVFGEVLDCPLLFIPKSALVVFVRLHSVELLYGSDPVKFSNNCAVA